MDILVEEALSDPHGAAFFRQSLKTLEAASLRLHSEAIQRTLREILPSTHKAPNRLICVNNALLQALLREVANAAEKLSDNKSTRELRLSPLRTHLFNPQTIDLASKM